MENLSKTVSFEEFKALIGTANKNKRSSSSTEFADWVSSLLSGVLGLVRETYNVAELRWWAAVRDLQRESLPTTHSEKQGGGEKKLRKSPWRYPSASSHHPSAVFAYISFHFYILHLPPSCLYPYFYTSTFPPPFLPVSSTGVCISACSSHLFFRNSWAAVLLSTLFLQSLSPLSHTLPPFFVSL